MPAGVVGLLARVSWSGSDGHGHTSYTDPVTYFVDQSGEVTVPAGNRSFSPDGDGVEDTTDVGFTLASQGTRSEEHTSELQSLMRISYAVFCLKKKKTKQTKNKIKKKQLLSRLLHK